ncbi:unnamed protein product [Orchesella dallaii]|uniref:Major facilitator superfamily (MFS) profile domain-containing protein n=1 Tax=Orchesella dallaii TaxID=48710 RepID=A0ABP1QPK0_9HEXA
MSAPSEESLSASTLASSTSSINPDPGYQNGDQSSHTTQFGTISRRLSRRLSLWRPKKRTTVLAVIVATIGSFCLGNVLTWSAPALVDEDFKKKFDTGNGSWIASLALLGALFSAPVSGFLIAKIGRRRTMLFTAIPFSIGWFLIAFAPDLPVLYVGRFLTGFCGGAFTVSVPAYVSEVTEDRIRGTLAVAFILMLCIGILFTFVLGALVNWFVLSVVCGCIPIIFFFSMLCMPESPRYLVMIQKPTAARNALKWLRRASTKRYIEPEISKIENSVTAANGRNNGDSSKVSDLFTLRVLKPIVISAALMFFAQLSGMNGVSLYTVEIFEEAGTQINAKIASIIIGATQAITVLVVPFVLVEKLGRRSLLIISEVVMCFSLTALGTYFYLKEQNGGTPPPDLEWLPLVSLVAITVGYNVGLGPIPWVLTAEILPNHVKELASSCISICYWSLSFVAGKTFKDIKDVIGYMGVYWLSAGICLFGAFFVFFFVPETKGRSTDEIQKLFVTKKELEEAENTTVQEAKPAESTDGLDNPAFLTPAQGANANANPV